MKLTIRREHARRSVRCAQFDEQDAADDEGDAGTHEQGEWFLEAVWSVLERLNVVSIIDEVAPRNGNANVSVGTYIALACANRVVEPSLPRPRQS